MNRQRVGCRSTNCHLICTVLKNLRKIGEGGGDSYCYSCSFPGEKSRLTSLGKAGEAAQEAELHFHFQTKVKIR